MGPSDSVGFLVMCLTPLTTEIPPPLFCRFPELCLLFGSLSLFPSVADEASPDDSYAGLLAARVAEHH